jgi:hypothetical protein
MDWSLPELSVDELREHAAGLAAQVAEAAERKERATLLGKIEGTSAAHLTLGVRARASERAAFASTLGVRSRL